MKNTGRLLFRRYLIDKLIALKFHEWKIKGTSKAHPVATLGFRSEAASGTRKEGPTHETLRQWILGIKTPKEDSLEGMCNFINSRFTPSVPITLELLSDSTTTRDFLVALGIDDETIQERQFSLWAQDVMLCKSFTFDSFGEAERFKTLPGRYLVRRMPLAKSDIRTEVLALTVHEPVPASSRKTERRLFFPCQLTIRPSAELNCANYQYIGAVGQLEHGFEWRFFQVGMKHLDRIEIMTSKAGSNSRLQMSGYLLTFSEGPDFRPVVSPAEVRRNGDLQGWAQDRDYLRDTPSNNEAEPPPDM